MQRFGLRARRQGKATNQGKSPETVLTVYESAEWVSISKLDADRINQAADYGAAEDGGNDLPLLLEFKDRDRHLAPQDECAAAEKRNGVLLEMKNMN